MLKFEYYHQKKLEVTQMGLLSPHTFVISLKTASARREHIAKEFTKQGIPFKFFDAITPGESLDSSMDALVPNLALNNQLGPREKACFMSHIILWKKCVDDNLPFIHIFEDDIVIGKNANLFFSDDDWLVDHFKQTKTWILKTETFKTRVKLSPSSTSSYLHYQFPLLRGTHYGAASYTISNKAARYLLNKIHLLSPDSLEPIDCLLFDMYLNNDNQLMVFQLDPCICIQTLRLFNEKTNPFPSSLQIDRQMNTRKIHFLIRALRFIQRAFLFIKKLPLKAVAFEQ